MMNCPSFEGLFYCFILYLYLFCVIFEKDQLLQKRWFLHIGFQG